MKNSSSLNFEIPTDIFLFVLGLRTGKCGEWGQEGHFEIFSPSDELAEEAWLPCWMRSGQRCRMSKRKAEGAKP